MMTQQRTEIINNAQFCKSNAAKKEENKHMPTKGRVGRETQSKQKTQKQEKTTQLISQRNAKEHAHKH